MLRAEVQDLTFCCAIVECGGFSNEWSDDYETKEDFLDSLGRDSGLMVSSFVDRDIDQEKAYEQLKEWFPILWQSPPRMGNHGKEIFMVVYDTKQYDA